MRDVIGVNPPSGRFPSPVSSQPDRSALHEPAAVRDARLQIRMRRLAELALREGTALSPAYHRAHRLWMIFGVPSFSAAMLVLWAMIAKAAAF